MRCPALAAPAVRGSEAGTPAWRLPLQMLLNLPSPPVGVLCMWEGPGARGRERVGEGAAGAGRALVGVVVGRSLRGSRARARVEWTAWSRPGVNLPPAPCWAGPDQARTTIFRLTLPNLHSAPAPCTPTQDQLVTSCGPGGAPSGQPDHLISQRKTSQVRRRPGYGAGTGTRQDGCAPPSQPVRRGICRGAHAGAWHASLRTSLPLASGPAPALRPDPPAPLPISLTGVAGGEPLSVPATRHLAALPPGEGRHGTVVGDRVPSASRAH